MNTTQIPLVITTDVPYSEFGEIIYDTTTVLILTASCFAISCALSAMSSKFPSLCTKARYSNPEEIIIKAPDSFDPKITKDIQCTICLEKIKGNLFKRSDFVVLQCTHLFHSDCIQSWVESEMERGYTAKCPICRSNIVELKNTILR